jgi:Tfp pilus assembly protein PilF
MAGGESLSEKKRSCIDRRLVGEVSATTSREVQLAVTILGPRESVLDRVQVQGRPLDDAEWRKLRNRLILKVLTALGLKSEPKQKQRILDFPTASREALEQNNEGVVRFKKGELYVAALHFAAALRLDPGYADAANNLGRVRYLEEEFEAAAGLFRRAIEGIPGYPLYIFNLGLTLERDGQLTAARDAYRRAVKHDPAYAQAQNNLGHLSIRLQSFVAARQALDQGLSAASDRDTRSKLYKNLGWLALQEGHPGEAMEHLSLALGQDATLPETHYLRAQALEQLPSGAEEACAAWLTYGRLAAWDESPERQQSGRAKAASCVHQP